MNLEMTKDMLLDMVKGTGGPGTYPPYPPVVDRVGELTGFPNERWEWRDITLRVMSEEKLLELYHALKSCK